MQCMLNKIKDEPTIFLFRKMWVFSKGNKGKVLLFLLLTVCSGVVPLIEPIVLAKLLNEIQINGISSENIKYILFLASSFIWLSLIFWIFHGSERLLEKENAFIVRRNYKEYLLGKVLNFNLNWHTSRDSGSTIDKVNKASSELYNFSGLFFRVIHVLMQMLGTAVALTYFNRWIGLFTLCSTIFSFFVLYQFDKKLVPQYKKLNKYENKIEAKIFDSISNIVSVIILNIKKNVLQNISKYINEPFKLYKRNVFLGESKWFVGDILFNTLIIVLPFTFYIGIIYRNSLAIEIGTLTALYTYLSRLRNVFFSFSGNYEEIIRRKTAVLNAESIEGGSVEDSQLNKRPIKDWREIKISNLNFSYQETEGEVHLDDVNLSLKFGERVALIGESGSGKTTFLKVLHGLYNSAQANVSIDGGQDLKTNFFDLDLKTMLVPQEPELFSASIHENITFGLDYEIGEIEEVVGLAEFSDVIEKLPKRLESIINEKGVNLSGGQKQRLALARALLFAQEKNIILLDESTSSVDPETEVKIYKSIFDNFKNKTIVASIHKINLLKYFDRIIMFKDGKIVDSGTFEELLKNNDKFRADWKEYREGF